MGIELSTAKMRVFLPLLILGLTIYLSDQAPSGSEDIEPGYGYGSADMGSEDRSGYGSMGFEDDGYGSMGFEDGYGSMRSGADHMDSADYDLLRSGPTTWTPLTTIS